MLDRRNSSLPNQGVDEGKEGPHEDLLNFPFFRLFIFRLSFFFLESKFSSVWCFVSFSLASVGDAFSLGRVFSAFGFVHKITTFEKTHGFQALIQFTDTETATSAKDALDGRSIPSYLFEEHVGLVNLKITYSAHTDLTVKFQSHRSRDYTNPYFPVAPSAIDGTSQEGQKGEPPSNVLLASIENMQYAVTVDVLHAVKYLS